MSIVIITPGRQPLLWKEAIMQTNPGIEVFFHDESFDPGKALFALAWNHPHGIFSRFPNLKCISSMGAGVDHLLSDPDIPPKVDIVRIVDPLLASDMYEFVLSLTMAWLRKLHHYAGNQRETVWEKKRYARISDITIGIMGTGSIGQFVATELGRIGFRVLGWGRTPLLQEPEISSEPGPPFKRYWGSDQLPEFLQQTNLLVCLLPLTNETRGILHSELFSLLPDGAAVINLGRGGHVADQDLIGALDSGHLSAAFLDVFNEEPLPPEHPFWHHPKIHISPHIASLTDPLSVAPQIVENYLRMLNGETLLNMVNRSLGY